MTEANAAISVEYENYIYPIFDSIIYIYQILYIKLYVRYEARISNSIYVQTAKVYLLPFTIKRLKIMLPSN